jgi:hypothetical protein
MSANRSRPHILVLPEDDANRQLANGFLLQVDWTRQRQMQVLPVADGWGKVIELFQASHVHSLERNAMQAILLLIDFDEDERRLEHVKAAIPQHLADRVFILGVWTEPEKLKADLGAYEGIGSRMAQECRDEVDGIWDHPLLRHNGAELARLREHVRPILF